MNTKDMRIVRLRAPVAEADLAALEQGDVVYLSGVIYTAREAVYKKVIDDGVPLPCDLAALSNVNFHCSPAVSVDDAGKYHVGAVTATASFRFEKWMKDWFDLSGARMIIGKGGMPEDVYRNLFTEYGARYLTTVGYGTGALLGRGIKKVRDVHWLEENGIAQALWVFEVEDLGPFIVDSDRDGNSLFARTEQAINARIEELYAGLKPPALKRYGETTSRADELIGDVKPLKFIPPKKIEQDDEQ